MTYVRDAAAAITMVHMAQSNKHLVYCIDAPAPTTWGEVEGILKELVPGCSLRFGRSETAATSRRPRKELNMAAEFGFRPKYGIREGLRETVEWFRNGQR
jgi:nucleoside-diphosphate-sugar epimerase